MNPLDLSNLGLRGVQMVEASAGTGKTYTITNLVLKLLLDPVDPLTLQKILLVSFTQASTQELVDRISKRLQVALGAMKNQGFCDDGDPFLTELVSAAWSSEQAELRIKQLKLAVQSLDDGQIYTLHSFCSRILTQFAFDSGQSFSDQLVQDSRLMVAQGVEDYWAKETYSLDPFHLLLLEQGGIHPTALQKLFGDSNQHTNLVVLSDDPPKPADLSRFTKLKADAVQLWDQERLTQKFESATGLNGNKFRKASWQTALSGTAQWLKSTVSDHSLPDHFELLTEQKILSAKKKTGTLPEDVFFGLAEQIWDESNKLNEYGETWCSAFLGRFLSDIKAQLETLKSQGNVLFFDDLLTRLNDALDSPQGDRLVTEVQKSYQVALIDEFQDTDGLQYRIFHRFFGAKPFGLFLIGDPKQAIYSFRGGDIFTYAKAREGADEIWGLGTNWRTDQPLVESVNHLFSHSKARPFYFDFIEFMDVESHLPPRIEGPEGQAKPLVVHWTSKEDQPDHGRDPLRIQTDWAKVNIPKQVARDIQSLLRSETFIVTNQGKQQVGPQDIAVLVRANAQAEQIRSALMNLGIPAVFQASSDLYKTPVATQFLRFLAALLNPQHTGLVRLALSGDFFGMSTSTMAELIKNGDELAGWMDRFKEWSELWINRGFVPLLNRWAGQVNLGENLLKRPEGKQTWASLRELIQSLQKENTLHHYRPIQLTCFLENQIKREDISGSYEPKPTDKPAVSLVTIHKSKGLEYPICFLPYLWSSKAPKSSKTEMPRVFHQTESPNLLCLDLRTEQEHHWEVQTEAHAEDLRLLYVALTRAKHQNHLYFGPFGPWEQSAFWYLIGSKDGEPDVFGGPQGKLLPYAQLKELHKGCDSSQIRQQIADYFADIQENIHWADAPRSLMAPALEPLPEPTPLTPWELNRSLSTHHRIGSYSALVRNASSHARKPVLLVEEGPGILLGEFPKGAQVGLFFHQLLETIDFTNLAPNWLTSQIQSLLKQYRMDPEVWAELLTEWLQQFLRQPVLGPGVSLSTLDKTKKLVEMEFFLSLNQGQPLTPERLASGFNQLAMADYSEKVKKLGFETLQGYLTGFIDLFFEVDGKYYVLDYKSNHLGRQLVDYGESGLAEAMAEHHYYLQAWLYSLAVHRFLGIRVPGYNYETHFGGCVYLFLRGVGSSTGGVYRCRPTESEIGQLDLLFGGRP